MKYHSELLSSLITQHYKRVYCHSVAGRLTMPAIILKTKSFTAVDQKIADEPITNDFCADLTRHSRSFE